MQHIYKNQKTTGSAGSLIALIALLFLAGFRQTAHAAQSVNLAWDPVPDQTVAGYNVYYGTASGVYTNEIPAGAATSSIVSGLAENVTYYFTVTAYDILGLESDFSNEVSYTVPGPVSQPRLQSTMWPDGTFFVSGGGAPGRTYQIEASTDLSTWTVLAVVMADGSGSFEFADWEATYYPSRFYRTRDTQP